MKFLRELYGMTQTDLAVASGTTQGRISKIERDSPQINDALRVRIARALHVNPHQLFPYLEEEAS